MGKSEGKEIVWLCPCPSCFYKYIEIETHTHMHRHVHMNAHRHVHTHECMHEHARKHACSHLLYYNLFDYHKAFHLHHSLEFLAVFHMLTATAATSAIRTRKYKSFFQLLYTIIACCNYDKCHMYPKLFREGIISALIFNDKHVIQGRISLELSLLYSLHFLENMSQGLYWSFVPHWSLHVKEHLYMICRLH